jgi:hypothetical protein
MIVLTKENIAKNKRLSSFLNTYNINFIPEPTYFYNIGDKVNIGELKNAQITDMSVDGRIYEIGYKHEKVIEDGDFRIWLDIRPIIKTDASFIKNDDIRINYMQTTIRSIFSYVYDYGVIFDQEYQRDYVWEEKDKINLIDSIFNNIDIGKFVFVGLKYVNTESKLYEILDGKQRISTILNYYENRFSYKGKYFNELSKDDRNHIINYNIQLSILNNLDRKQKLRYFITLNKHGKIMNKTHLDKIEKLLNEITEEEG